jgi:AcrR family transcriptional regulator
MAARGERPDGRTRPREVQGFRHGRVPRAVRARQLVECAEALFLERGLQGVSVEEVCRAAGVSRPVFYDHFDSLTGAYVACVRRIRVEFQEMVVAEMAGTETAELSVLFQVAGEAFFSLIEQNPRRWALFYGFPGLYGEAAEQLESLREDSVQVIAALISARRPELSEADVMVAAQMISGGGEQLGRWWLRHRGEASRDDVIGAYRRYTSAALHSM